MLKIISVVALFSFMAHAQDGVGFSKGNNLTGQEVRGSFTLHCPTQTRFASCSGSYLSPVNRDHFVHPEVIDADKVELSTTNSRGRSITKRSGFDSSELRSKKRFNLWLASLLQRPLLKYGPNTISYKLSKEGEVIKEGTFEVNVERAPTIKCDHAVLWGSSDRDCDSPYSYCQRYFARCL